MEVDLNEDASTEEDGVLENGGRRVNG
jgi:hypothetical protein